MHNQKPTVPGCQPTVEDPNLREKQHERIFLPVEEISLSQQDPSMGETTEISAQWKLKF